MMDRFIERENQIFDKLEEFKENDLNFILVGGYAVSAFNHRFSVDADIVIKDIDQKKFSRLLAERQTFHRKRRMRL